MGYIFNVLQIYAIKTKDTRHTGNYIIYLKQLIHYYCFKIYYISSFRTIYCTIVQLSSSLTIRSRLY